MGIVTSYITCPSTRYGAGTRGILTRGRAARDFNNPSQSAEMTLNKLKKKKRGWIKEFLPPCFVTRFVRFCGKWKIGGRRERIAFITTIESELECIVSFLKRKTRSWMMRKWNLSEELPLIDIFRRLVTKITFIFHLAKWIQNFIKFLIKKKEKEILDRRKFFDIL